MARASTHTFFTEFNPVRPAASFVYTGAASGGIGATAGQREVSSWLYKDVYYQVRALASGSVTFSIEGRCAFKATWAQIDKISITTAQATWYKPYVINEKIDLLRVGIRAASPAALDRVNVYGGFKN